MTNREAIKVIEWIKNTHPEQITCEALDMAISALEKQIPKKPNRIDKNASFDGNWKKVCPACGRLLIERITTPEESYPRIYNYTQHCICGQAIDWEEKHEKPIMDIRQHRPQRTCRILNEHREKAGGDYHLCGYRCAGASKVFE